MKNYKNKIIIVAALLLTISFLMTACSSINEGQIIDQAPETTTSSNEIQSEDEIDAEESPEPNMLEEKSSINLPAENSEAQQDVNISIPETNNGISEEEIASLIFMREEEKLAKDVYLGLYELWGVPIFQNIASSEQTHTDAVKGLLDTFGIEDPADNSPTGVFANQDLQNLYNQLMAAGSQSLEEALKVGGAIEEIDILDLKQSLEFIKNPSIIRVYQSLLQGSENHLRAFTSNLERQTNESYQPQYLTQVDYDAILSSSSSRGRGGNGKNP